MLCDLLLQVDESCLATDIRTMKKMEDDTAIVIADLRELERKVFDINFIINKSNAIFKLKMFEAKIGLAKLQLRKKHGKSEESKQPTVTIRQFSNDRRQQEDIFSHLPNLLALIMLVVFIIVLYAYVHHHMTKMAGPQSLCDAFVRTLSPI
jgi:hypothetical protein